jgi:hypothetical protein
MTKFPCGFWNYALPLSVYQWIFVCNRILSTCIYPDRLKYSIAKPLHKKDKQAMSNYRPISLITSFSKMVEKVMRIKYNILSSEQLVAEKIS